MANYYVPLPSPQAGRNALLDFSPVNNALNGVRDQNNANRNALLQQQQMDMRKDEQTYQRGRDQKQDDLQLKTVWGKRAQAVALQAKTDPQGAAAAWQNMLKQHPNMSALGPEYLDVNRGPSMVMAEAGIFNDPRDDRMKDLEIQKAQAQINAANQSAEQGKIVSVGNRLVRVSPNGAQEIYNAGPDLTKAPQGYTFDPTGTKLEPIPGGPGDKLTEGESKDALFAERMLRSERDLQAVAPIDQNGNFTAYNPAQARNVMWPDKGVVANLFNSKEWQSYQRAARESLSAILRKDTGAAVTDEEFATYFPTYFPIPGDSPQVVREKEIARKNVASGMRGASSRAFDRMYPNYDELNKPKSGGANDLKSKYGLE